jgi:hypothetical protein
MIQYVAGVSPEKRCGNTPTASVHVTNTAMINQLTSS